MAAVADEGALLVGERAVDGGDRPGRGGAVGDGPGGDQPAARLQPAEQGGGHGGAALLARQPGDQDRVDLSAHGISTGVAALTTTTVRRAAAATAATRASCAPGQGERGLVAGLGLLLLGQPDDDHGDVGVPGRGDGGVDRLVVGSGAGRATSPTIACASASSSSASDQVGPSTSRSSSCVGGARIASPGMPVTGGTTTVAVDLADGDRPGADADDTELERAAGLDPAAEPDARDRPRDVVAEPTSRRASTRCSSSSDLAVGGDQLGTAGRAARPRDR